MPKAGESLMRKDLGKLYMHSFKLTSEDGKQTIEPWKGKKAYSWEWLRNDSALDPEATLREEKTTFYKIEKDAAIYYNGEIRKRADLAVFTSEVDGTKLNIAARLLPEKINEGDSVTLTILGCCSIISVEKT